MGKCNWELYELRVAVYGLAPRPRIIGTQILAVPEFHFFKVELDLNSLGINDFQGSNDDCNFTAVFSELVKKKIIPFIFKEGDTTQQYSNKNQAYLFGGMQNYARYKVTLPVTKLYVHRRDQGGLVSFMTGFGVLLQNVVITDMRSPNYIKLQGGSATPVNF